MAKDGRKQPNRGPSGKAGEPKEKKSFWSYFFEPIPEDEDDAGFFDDDFDDVLADEAEPLEETAPAQIETPAAQAPWTSASLTPPVWTDGAFSIPAPIVTQPAPAPVITTDNPYVPLGTVTTDNPYVPLGTVTTNPYVPQGTVTTDNPYVPLGTVTTDNPYVPLGAVTTDNPYVPLGTVTTDNPYVPLDAATAVVPGSLYAPVLDPVTGAPTLPAFDPMTGLPIVPIFDPMTGQPILPKFDPMTGRPIGETATVDAGLADDDGETRDGDGDDIRLFDEVGDATDARNTPKGQTTRLFRTGTDATTRIHINETEDALRMEEAAKRARAREAREKHDAAMERKNKRRKRSTILRKLFANVAFVLFFIVAVVVALYYGFLLSDIVILGNDTYASDYIIELSGLQLGRHMLLCDLEGAADNIRQDPYLQVEQVNYIFPSRIRIVVKERKEVAGIIGLDYNVIIDDQGYVLSMSGGTDLTGLLQVTGVSMTGFQLGQQLGEGNDLGTETLVQIIGKLEEYELMGSVKSIDMTTPLAITFVAKNGLSIHLGQATDLDNKMSMFARLYPQFVNQNIYQGTLYLSAKGGTVYSPPGAQGDISVTPAPIVTDPTPADTTLPDQGAPDDMAAPTTGDGTTGDGAAGGDMTLPDVTPEATPTAPPTPTPYNPAGSADEWQG